MFIKNSFKKGMTLIEIMLAVSILGMASAAMYRLLDSGMDVYREGHWRNTVQRMTRNYNRMLSDDLSKASYFSKIWEKPQANTPIKVETYEVISSGEGHAFNMKYYCPGGGPGKEGCKTADLKSDTKILEFFICKLSNEKEEIPGEQIHCELIGNPDGTVYYKKTELISQKVIRKGEQPIFRFVDSINFYVSNAGYYEQGYENNKLEAKPCEFIMKFVFARKGRNITTTVKSKVNVYAEKL